MTRHGRRRNDRTKQRWAVALVVALSAAGFVPARALAWDSPIAPVTPAAEAAAQHGLGLDVAPQAPLSAATIQSVTQDAVGLPASVDLTPWAVPPGDQGQVNSCAAWATGYTALGYYEKRQNIAGGVLAPMYTYSQLVHGQNIGTYIDDHLVIAKTQGVDSQADYNWGNYDYGHTPTAAQKTNAAHWVSTGYTDLAHVASSTSTVTQSSIQAALADGKPVVIGIPVYANFYSVSSANHGLYTGISGAFQGNHAVTALGYSAAGLRIENSWGPYWGDAGFATLSWAFVNTYVNQATAVGELIDANSTPDVLAAPTISGATARGMTLTSTTGRFTASPTSYAYQWQRDSAGNGTYADISGATGATYATTADDVGAHVRVTVTAANATGSAQSTSAAVGPITPVTPASTVAPVLSGTTARGSTLTVTPGGWTDSPTSYTYVWQRAAASTYATITGATAASYTLQSADVGMNVRVLVSAKNAIGTGTAYSNVLGPVAKSPPAGSTAPTVAGTAARGSVLTAAPGTWAGVGNTYAYQWQRDAGAGYVVITGATAVTYTLQAADESAKVRVRVTASNVDGSAIAYSDPTGAVAKAPPVNSSIPTPTGTTARSGVLTAGPGSWAGVGNTYAYQWQRDAGAGYVAIASATGSTYTLQAADESAKVRVRVTATNVDGAVAAYSEEVGPIAKTPPVNSVVPAVNGTAARASVLTATGGTWSAMGNTYALQWQRDSGSGYADIAGATKGTYTLAVADEGAKLRMRVTATNVDGSAVAYSAEAGPIAAAPPVNAIAPAITGAVVRTAKLTATAGSWTGAGNTYAFQWQRSSGSDFADIAGATASTYTLGPDDVGEKVRVRVTGTNVDAVVATNSPATTEVGRTLPTQTIAPVASGAARTATTLSATTGTWTPAGSTYAYQWQRDGGSGFAAITGATASTYTLTDDDAGAKVRVQVTATNSDGSTVGSSNAIGPVLSTPKATVAPALSGALMDANVQTAAPGTWTSAGGLTHSYKYEWIRCPATATLANSTGCKTIVPAAASATYTSVAADVGSRLAVRVTATNSQNVASTAVSAVTDVLTGRPLTNSTLPAVTGTPMVHEGLRVDNGAWSVPLTGASYQWRRCAADGTDCVDIVGAKAATYTPVVADTGAALVARVNVGSPGRTASADSDPTDPIDPLPLPTAVTPVAIRGTAARLQTLTAIAPAWNAYPTLFAYQWLRCDASGDACTAIAGATKTTYIAVVADEGHKLRLRLDATNTTGAGTSTSEATAVTAAAPAAVTAAPVISGNAVAGVTLSAGRGTWSAPADTTYTYAWQRCAADGTGCAAVSGAVAATFKLAAADVDHTLRAVVTATNPDGPVSSTSAATAKVKPAAPSVTIAPVLSGTPQVGKTLTITAGTWAGTSEDAKATFYRCTRTCIVAQTGTARTYTLVAADAGANMRAAITATGAGGSTTSTAAAILGPVKSAASASVLAGVGAPVSLRSTTGAVLAKATIAAAAGAAAAGATPAGPVTVTVKSASKLKGRYRVWACPTAATGADWQPCTAPATLSAKGAHLRVALDAGEKVRVVVARAGRK